MATEFNDAQHWGIFTTGQTLTSQTGKMVRQSELTLAALRAAGVLDIMEDGTTAPAHDRLWLDKTSDPAVLKEWDSVGSTWQPMTFDRLFGRATVTDLVNIAGTANAITCDEPSPFMDGKIYGLVPTLSNMGATTIQVAGVGTYGVVYPDGSDIAAGELSADLRTPLLFANGRFEVLFGSNAGSIKRSEVDASTFGFVLDEDDMASDSATKVPTQQSVAAYNRKREAWSLLDFGAKGDGSTDDTVSIQSALDSGESLIVPPGDYVISAGLTSTGKDVSMRGVPGALSRFKFSDGGLDIEITSGTHTVQLENVSFTPVANCANAALNIHAPDFLATAWMSVRLNDVRVGASDWSSFKFDEGIHLTKIFNADMIAPFVDQATTGIIFEDCIGMSVWRPEIIAADLGISGVDTMHGMEGLHIFGGNIYNGKVAMDIDGMINGHVDGIYLQGSQRLLRLHGNVQQSAFTNILGYANFGWDGSTDIDAVELDDGVRGNTFTGWYITPNGAAIGHHNGFRLLSGAYFNIFDACRINTSSAIILDTGADDNIIGGITDGIGNGTLNVTDNAARTKYIGTNTTGGSSLLKFGIGSKLLTFGQNITTNFSGPLDVGGSLSPKTSDGGALGSATAQWSDVFLASGGVINFANGNMTITHANNNMTFSGNNWIFNSLAIRPFADNVTPLGNTSFRWSTVYAGTGTINTSDEREKVGIEVISDAVLDAWGDVEWSQFKFVRGSRIHAGLIAQRVVTAFEKRGLDAMSYGVVCYDKWEEEPEVRDHDGKIIQPKTQAGDRYGIRYDEAQALEAAWVRRELGRLAGR